MTAFGEMPRIASTRPEMTAAVMAETGLDEDVLRDLVVKSQKVVHPIWG